MTRVDGLPTVPKAEVGMFGFTARKRTSHIGMIAIRR